ncbi:hypothetical protein LINPERPRIM_LOCUS26014, partial [Linum perenne]
PISSTQPQHRSIAQPIPSNKDFHFFNNFDEFKTPVNRIASKSHSLLDSIGSSGSVFKQKYTFPSDIDNEEASDWFVNVNDEVLERFESLIGSISTKVGLDLKSGQNPFTLKSEILLSG